MVRWLVDEKYTSKLCNNIFCVARQNRSQQEDQVVVSGWHQFLQAGEARVCLGLRCARRWLGVAL